MNPDLSERSNLVGFRGVKESLLPRVFASSRDSSLILRNKLRNLGVGHVEKNGVDPECQVCTVCPQKANGDKIQGQGCTSRSTWFSWVPCVLF